MSSMAEAETIVVNIDFGINFPSNTNINFVVEQGGKKGSRHERPEPKPK
jgi:hypothetical protein